MSRIDPETVQRILDTADIVEVVSDFVKLRRSGANYKGLCPFHSERTPSFSVNKARNICKCFSCGKGGSPVNFIMEHEQMSYSEALRYLARKYNIEIIEKEQSDAERQAQSRREALYAVNAFALDHFKDRLQNHADGREIAMAYIRHRGISDAMVERFHLGYAIDKGSDFVDAAHAAGFRDEFMLETGLISRSERDGSVYDRYRGRVIFPIHSLSGRVVGFGARTMRSDKNIAKYVNSPECDIYHKKSELYGLYQARSAIARRDKCIMVEGYLDVISMHQAGVENVVASSGTSLTEEQIRLIHRFTENVTLIYDADAAGIKASLRGINLLLAEKMNVKVLALPQGDDPDSFAQSHSSSEVEQYLLDNEVDIIAFMVSKLMQGVSANDPTARAKVINEILQTVAFVEEPVKRQEYIAQCSRLLNVSEEVLIPQLNIFITKRLDEEYKQRQRDAARATISDIEQKQPETPPTGEDKASAEASGGDTGATEDSPVAEPEVNVPLLQLNNDRLRPYESMLACYIVRYGLLTIDVCNDDGSTIEVLVYDYIKGSFMADNRDFTCPEYLALDKAFAEIRETWPAEHNRRGDEIQQECARKIEELQEDLRANVTSFAEIEKREKLAQREIDDYRVAELEKFDMNYGQTRLINSADETVRRVANELLPERYTLSRIYEKGAHYESEQNQLNTLVPRAVCELRSAIIAGIIKDLTVQLATISPENADEMINIMAQINQWKEFQRTMSKQLGERIILPKIR